jgi:hypothetical protein
VFDLDQEKEFTIPVSQDMIMIKVDDKEEEKIGYVLFYPSKDKTFMIERDYGAADQKSMDILK